MPRFPEEHGWINATYLVEAPGTYSPDGKEAEPSAITLPEPIPPPPTSTVITNVIVVPPAPSALWIAILDNLLSIAVSAMSLLLTLGGSLGILRLFNFLIPAQPQLAAAAVPSFHASNQPSPPPPRAPISPHFIYGNGYRIGVACRKAPGRTSWQ